MKMTFELNDETDLIHVTSTNSLGITSTKQVQLEDFIKSIGRNVRVTAHSSGLLPSNILHYKMLPESHEFVLLYDPNQADLAYEKTTYERFPIPRLVFGIELSQDGRVRGKRIGVIEQGKVHEGSKMYRYPFGNLSASGHVCVGGNVLPVYKKLTALKSFPDHILRLPNNDDHYNSNNTKLRLSQRNLMEHLKDKNQDYYYEHVLVPSGSTLQGFLKG
jgi:hypothetical protein